MAVRISPPQNKTYYINPAYLTFVENSGYGANLIQVSASSSCYISVYDPVNGIGYSDADRNYQRWKVTAYNNKFPETDENGNVVPTYKGKWYIYVRLERSGTSALVVYDQVLRSVKGGVITVSKDENGNDVYTEAESTQDAYWFIRIGEVGPTDGTSIREITYDTGYLTSDEALNDKTDESEMWRLDKFSTPNLIEALYALKGFVVRGFITLFGGLIFKNKDGVEKSIVDIKRSTDNDVPVDDTTIPTTAYLQSLWSLDRDGESWMLRARYILSSFSVKGVLSLIGKLVFINAEGIKKPVVDIKRSIDKDVLVDDTTIPTTAYIRSISDDRYLKKNEPDETEHLIKFTKAGIQCGNFVEGMTGGAGTRFDGEGYGEMNGLTLREFLEVPELRFNRIDVVSGELWNSIAFGLVEKVDTGKHLCWIKLEDKERCGLHVYDICRGIFADFGDSTQWEGVDECGFMHLYGFWTAYFTPTRILENDEGVFCFQYELKAGTTQHPRQSMKFAVYGNFVDASRQASAYSTRTYKRYLNKVDTWTIDPDKHIYAQYGDLEGLTIGSVTMHGYGSFQSNAYFKGVQVQLTPSQMESLKGESAYTAVLSDYEGVVTIDDEGNVIGGEKGTFNVVTSGENVITSKEDGTDPHNVITGVYRLRTEVQAMRGNTQLFYSPVSPGENSFILSISPVGCNAMVLNGVVVVSFVSDPDDAYVGITVNCEGNASFHLVYRVNAVRDGKNPVIADIDNEMDSVACDSSGKVLFGLPVSCTVSMWAGTKKLALDNLEVINMEDYKDSDGQTVSVSVEHEEGKVTVNDIADRAPRTLPLSLVAYGTYGGIQYHRELVFTVNKVNAGENALLYRLSPSVSSVKVDDEGNMSAEGVSCNVVASDGSHIELLESPLPDGVALDYSIDGDAQIPYTDIYGTPVGITNGNREVAFRLFFNGELIDVETVPILLDGSSPVFVDLDNEMHSVACDENGRVVLMPEISTRVHMFWGSRELDAEVVGLEVPEGVEASFEGANVTVPHIPDSEAPSDDTVRIGIKARASYGDTVYDRTAYMVINKIRQGYSAMVLDLVPSVSSVKIDKEGKYNPGTVSCMTKVTTGKNGSFIPSGIQDKYSMQYSVDGRGKETYSYGTEIAVSPEYGQDVTAATRDITFYLYYSEDNGVSKQWMMVDKETVPVLMDAADAFKSTVFRRTNGSVDIPTGGSYDSPVPEDKDGDGNPIWSDGIPSGDEVLWASVRTFTSDGEYPQDDEWSVPVQMTDTSSFDVEFSSVEDPGPPSGHPNTNAQWSDVSDENTVWMATSVKTNGEWGPWNVSKIKGEKGESGKDGNGITGVTEYYLAYSKNTGVTTSTSGWSPSVPTLDKTNKYLWNYEEITYTDKETTRTAPVVIGMFSKDGKGIKNITEYYAVHTSSTSQPYPWYTYVPSLTPTYKYLWNYEVITYTDDTISQTTPAVIGVYGDKGVGLSDVTEHYLVYPRNTGVTVYTPGWQDSMPTLDANNKYLWNYETAIYTDGTQKNTMPVVIGMFSKDGKGIESVTEYYARHTSPTSAPDSWVTSVPELTSHYKYLWNYEEITYTDGSKSETSPAVVGVYGDKGDNGDDASVYTVLPNISSIRKTMTGTLSPETVEFTCYMDTGSLVRTPAAAKWYVYYTNTPDEESSWVLWNNMSSTSISKASHSVTFNTQYRHYRIKVLPHDSREYLMELSVVSDGQDGKDGSPGPRGAMPRYRGEFDPLKGEKYVYNDEYRDIVVYEGNVFQVWKYDTEVTATPNVPSGNSNDGSWEMASKFSFVAMDTALVDGANIAGFEFKNQKMVSRKGDLVIDGVNGTLECESVKLKGEIHATSGSFTGEIHATSGSFIGEINATSGSFTGTLNSSSGSIGGFSIGEYSMVNNGIGTDSYGMSNTVSLTPYDGQGFSFSSMEVDAISGGSASLSKVSGFAAGIKSKIGSTKSADGASNAKFATVGGYFEGSSSSVNSGAVGVWGKAVYGSGYPYILAGVVGTDVSEKISNFTKAQAGVVGFSDNSYGVYAKGGEKDVWLANSSIGNFGIGAPVAADPINFNGGALSGNNVFIVSSNATLPLLSETNAGRMILVINDSSDIIKVYPSGGNKIRTTMSIGNDNDGAYTEIYKRSAMFFISLGATYNYWFGFKAYDQ